MKTQFFAVAFVIILIFSQVGVANVAPPIPNPILVFTGAEYYTSGGKALVRYRYDVFNKDAYPNDMFAASPFLPPCGTNKAASRTWIDFFDQHGKRLYGFCALENPGNLNSIWFSTDAEALPPSWVYIEMWDRQTGTKYKSNLAETVM